MKYIGIGNLNKYKIYLLIAILCEFLANFLTGINNANKERPARIFPFRAKLQDHKILNSFILFVAIFIGGIFLYFFERRNKREKAKDEVTIEDYEKMKINILGKKDGGIISNLIFIGILYSFALFFQSFIDSSIGLWTLEILNIGVISYLISKNKIYKHKQIAIYVMLVVTIIVVVELFIPSTRHKSLENMNELTDKNTYKVLIIKYGAYSIPILLIANEIRYCLRDFCWLKMKYLMDIKSFSPYKIYLAIGSIGIILIAISFPIFTYVPCKTFNNINKTGNNYFNNNGEALKLYLEYCTLKDYDEKTKTLYIYYDSMKIISREYSNTDKNNMLEIFLLIPLLIIIFSVQEVSRLIIIRYNDPNNILIYGYFYYFMKNLIQIILNEGDEQYMRHDKFAIKELENLAGIITGLIYIEVIELKFCKLDFELKKNIERRGTEDIIKGLNMRDSLSKEDEIELNENINEDNANN